jgi:hypothetical protein
VSASLENLRYNAFVFSTSCPSATEFIMGNVLAFKKPVAASKGMCRHGFHRWLIVQEKQFDVQQGKLVTVWRCERCQVQKVTAT